MGENRDTWWWVCVWSLWGQGLCRGQSLWGLGRPGGCRVAASAKARQASAEAAQEVFGELRDFLADKNLQARQSLDEAGEQLHALFRLEVPNSLNPTLLSTNAIENAFKNLRRHIGRVCRWREDTNQADRWVASGLSLAQRGFRRVRGYQQLPELIRALEIAQQKQASKETT